MKKVIALRQPNDQQIITSLATATKNKWWITYNVEVEYAPPETEPSFAKNDEVPKVGNYLSGLNGYIYKITKLRPVLKCYTCESKGINRIYNKFYCTQHYKKLVITQPIKRQESKIHRNESCPCKSGKKFKNCCLKSQPVKGGHFYDSEYKRQQTS